MSEKTKFKGERLAALIFIILMLISLIGAILGKLYNDLDDVVFYVAAIVSIILLIIAVTNFIILNKNIKSYREFLKSGKLIKDLPFIKHNLIEKVEKKSSMTKFIPVVDYITKDGKTITIGGEYGIDTKKYGDKKTIDLYIDENNLKNYIIDFDLEDKIKNNELD